MKVNIITDKTAYLQGLADRLRLRKDPNNDLEWNDIALYMSEQTGTSVAKEYCRKGAPLFYLFDEAGWVRNPDNSENSPDDSQYMREMQKERIKLQTEKLEYNKWLRENARDELLIEKFVEKLRELPPVRVPVRRSVQRNHRVGTLIYGDAHVGSSFKIKGLNGEIINEYSFDIFKDRMWQLFNEVIDICEREGFEEINVFDLGDMVAGVLRASQLTQLEMLSVDATCAYMQFMSEWLSALTEYVNVHYQMTGGNHDQLRLLGQPKNSFPQENMSKIIKAYIKATLADNPNFTFEENPTGMIFADLAGFTTLGIHGEVKDMSKAVKDLSSVYDKKIDILVAGHLHHYAGENVGYNVETVRAPSIVGIDHYSMSLNRASNAGALFMIVEENIGLVTQHFIKLN